MTHDRVEIIDRTVEKTHAWLNELAAELGTDDKRDPYRALRAVMHAIGDRLTVDETAHWRPSFSSCSAARTVS